jgi:hypothetical protein
MLNLVHRVTRRLNSAVQSLREKTTLGFKNSFNDVSKVKVVYVVNISILRSLAQSCAHAHDCAHAHVYVTSVYQKQVGTSFTTCKFYGETVQSKPLRYSHSDLL